MSTAGTTVDQSAKSAIIALLRVLSCAKVKFLRYFVLDIGGNVRCKAIPIEYLQKRNHTNSNSIRTMLDGVAFVQVCIGGFPSYGDEILIDSGLTATGTVWLRPDLSTLQILPYSKESAIVFGTLYNNHNNNDDDKLQTTSDLCCRTLLRQIVDQAKNLHLLSFNIGVELEFVLLGATTNVPMDRSQFANVTLLNQQDTFLSSLHDALLEQEISIELLHSESAMGQMEIVLEYCNDPVEMADKVVLARETIIALARQFHMKAVFLPKIYDHQAGNGCHVHVSIDDVTSGRNVFGVSVDDNNTLESNNDPFNHKNVIMSIRGQQFVEGILTHLPSLMAITTPTTNSFRRVGPGCWTGSQAIWGVDDKNAPIRIVIDQTNYHNINNTRMEYKLCDSTANIYLALSAILIAGLDGITNKMSLREALSHTKVSGCSGRVGETLPGTITESLDLLEVNDVLNRQIPTNMMKGYLAIRRAEVKQHTASNLSLNDEFRSAYERA